MKAGWKRKCLDAVCARITDGSHYSPKSQADGFPYITVRDVNDKTGLIDFDSCKFVSQGDFDNLARNGCRPSKGDVLFSKDGTVGKVALVQSDRQFVVLSSLAILTPNRERITPEYLEYVLRSSSFLAEAIGKKTGVAIKRIVLKNLKKIEIPIPPLEEQQRIVAVLDEAFDGLTRARAHAEANLQNARELFESYLGNVFGDGNWPEKTLDQISENLDRVRVPITKSERVAGDIPYYGASGVVDHVADYLFDEDLLLVSEDGANLLARTYPIAFSISGKSWVNNHAHALRFDDPAAQEFVRLYLNSISLEPYVSGMAQPKLNQKQLNRIPIPFPDDATRSEIVRRAHAISEETQRLQGNYEAALQDLEDLRQSLLQKAFAGELT